MTRKHFSTLSFRLTPLRCVFSYLTLSCCLLSSQAVATEQALRYGIKNGDTLISIAAEYLIKPNAWQRLQTLNRIADPKRLVPGSTLRIPVSLLRRDAAAAQVIYIRGSATFTPRGAARQALQKETQLKTGDSIETGPDSNVSLRFVDGTRLLLAPNSHITLSEMILFGKTGIAQTLLELHRGQVETQAAKQVQPAARYEIKSRALNLAVRGTDFRVSAEDTTAAITRSEVLEGGVEASGTARAVNVPAGFGTLAAAGEKPRPPIKLAAAPQLAAAPVRVERLPLNFKWEATPGIVRYRAQIFSGKAFDQLELDAVFQSNAAKWADLPDGSYQLRVRAIDADGLEGLNSKHMFVLKARPEPPFIIGPADGAKVYGPQAVFSWSGVNVAQHYHFQLSAQADFSQLLLDLPKHSSTSHTQDLKPGRYYWRIASVAAGNDHGPFSDLQSFTQKKIPESPALEPPQVSDKELLIRWRAGEAGSTYRLQFSRDENFNNISKELVLDSHLAKLENPAAGTHFARIQTIDSEGFAGPYGATQKLEVPAAPSKPWWLLLLLIPLAF